MKKIMVAVMSQDGFIASETIEQSSWTSEADMQRFSELKEKHDLFIMGRRTYEDNAGNIRKRPGLLRIVMTRTPAEYTTVEEPGFLEFTTDSPKEIITKYSNHETCLILGGSMVYGEFLGANLVDEIDLTIEPVSLGSGVTLLPSGRKLSEIVKLPEPKITELNDRGTLLYHYTLNK